MRPGAPFLLGVNGAQGTGKSTLADYLKLALESSSDINVAVLSIDDFYLTKAERTRLAAEVHPLLETRGVPGTHDTAMIAATLDALRDAGRRRDLFPAAIRQGIRRPCAASRLAHGHGTDRAHHPRGLVRRQPCRGRRPKRTAQCAGNRTRPPTAPGAATSMNGSRPTMPRYSQNSMR